MEPILPRKIDLLIGVSGCGKTSLAKALALDYDRTIIIDHRQEYSLGTIYTDFETLVRDLEIKSRFMAIWRGDPEYVEDIFHLAFALRKVCMLMEEAEIYPVDIGSYYREAILRGRDPAAISIIALTQRPHLLVPDLRSQATGIYAFRNMDPAATQWLKPVFGKQANDLPTMPILHGIKWCWDEPEIKTFEVTFNDNNFSESRNNGDHLCSSPTGEGEDEESANHSESE